jgi:drug/metabolite transporter (DMT)-like permease
MPRERVTFLLAIGALLLAVICWGLAPVANRYLLVSVSPLHLVVLRFVVASLLFVPVIWQMRKQNWSRRDGLLAIFCGLASILGYNVTVTFGLQWVPAGIAGLLGATTPLWIALLSRIFQREPLHWAVSLGLILGLSGVLTLVGWTALRPGQSGSLVLLGIGLVILAYLMWAVYTIAVRPLSRKYGALVSTAITTFLGSLPLVVLWDQRLLPTFAALQASAWFAFVLLALGSTVIATVLWNYGVARLPSAQAGVFLNVMPVVSVLGGSFFLHEQITPGMLVGGAIILISVVVAQLPSLIVRQVPVREGDSLLL